MTSNPAHPAPLDRQRRLLLKALASGGAISLGLAPGSSAAQSYPTRLIHLVVPFPAGGPTDIVARPLAQILSNNLGQSVVVDNRGGAGGSVAADYVAKSAADGYTLLMGTVGTHAINLSLYRKLSYHPVNDFTPLGLVASAPLAVVVNAKSPYMTLADLVAAAKKQPGRLSFGSAGNGTPGHLTGEMFAKAAEIKFAHIPYKGSAPAVSDLLGQQILLMFDPVQSVLPHVQSGKLRALAVSSSKRSPVLPQVPTIAESGFPGFEAEAWWAMFAPANLPSPIAKTLSAQISQIVRSDAFREKLGNLGLVPATDDPRSFADFQRAEIEKWGKAVQDSGAKVD